MSESRELLAAKPAYLTKSESPVGLEAVQEVMSPPILKIVQSNARDVRLKDEFKAGEVVILPDYLRLAAEGESFTFTPLLMFTEAIACNPLGVDPFIRERTRDKEHEVYRKSQLRGDDAPHDPCPEKPEKEIRYYECMNWLVLIDGYESPLPVLLSFRSTEFKTGRKLANLVMGRGADIYAGRYTARVEEHSNSEGEWFGFALSNADNPWVTEENLATYAKAHEMFYAKLKEDAIQTDYDATESGNATEAEPDAPSSFDAAAASTEL